MKINIKVFIYNFENYNFEDTVSSELVEDMPFVEEVLILSMDKYEELCDNHVGDSTCFIIKDADDGGVITCGTPESNTDAIEDYFSYNHL